MGYALQDIAVLYRTNLEPRLLMERLMEYNIPFQIRDALPNLYDHWITQDILAYLALAADTKKLRGRVKREHLLRVINRPKRYVSRELLETVEISWRDLKLHYRNKAWMVERIEQLEYDLGMIASMAPAAAVNYIRKGIGYDSYLQEYAEYRRMKPEELLETADQLQESASGYQTVAAWQQHMKEYGERLKQQAADSENHPDCVTLMTMHSSKGLEFPIVYILDANERITPHHKAVLEADLEEERRMFYVAMTRAKDRLHVCYVKNRYGKPQDRSRFINEYWITGTGR
jgi:DNA helicase-2/ATP-dependent DNA helicase PcrA